MVGTSVAKRGSGDYQQELETDNHGRHLTQLPWAVMQFAPP